MENPWKWHLTYNKVVVVENKLLNHRNTFYSWEKNKDRHFKKNLITFFFSFFRKNTLTMNKQKLELFFFFARWFPFSKVVLFRFHVVNFLILSFGGGARANPMGLRTGAVFWLVGAEGMRTNRYNWIYNFFTTTMNTLYTIWYTQYCTCIYIYIFLHAHIFVYAHGCSISTYLGSKQSNFTKRLQETSGGSSDKV